MKKCYELLQNVLLDAFDISAIYFTPPYDDIRKIDLGIRAIVWPDYSSDTKIQFSDLSKQQNRILIIQSNLGFYNIIIFWENNNDKDFISIGPFRSHELSSNYFVQILKESHLDAEHVHQIQYIYENMPFAQLDTVVNVIKHILGAYIPEFKELTPEYVEYTDYQRPAAVSSDALEYNFMMLSEQYTECVSRFLKHLKSGDNINARKALHLLIHEARLGLKPTLKNYKAFLNMLNDFCHLTMLPSTIHPAHILQLASSLGTRIQNTTSLEKLEQMANDICHKYCLLVKNHAAPEHSKLTRDVIAYVQFHLDEQLSLNQIAKYFDRNPSALSNLFSKETGQSLTTFIQQTRIQEAIRLFNTTDMSVSEVSIAIGYHDFSYFSKIFSKFVGTSPRDYKLQRR